ncbi:MAG: Terephthalate 1,2-dioxygenase, reductase component 1 [Microgenomates bacterium OLB23]|nr:MAG: Terephthalate 1,2-dioxygenase, reductase component 1 [Microgenomates bacterium OLB23]
MVQDYEATLTKKTEVAPEIWYYQFDIPEGQSLDFVAGQYMLLNINNNYRQYSIASADTIHNSFDLLVETIPGGLGSNYLMNLPIGNKAQFKGPAGVFVLKNTPRDKIFLATGTGVAPIKSMIESYFGREQHNASLTLFFGLKNRDGVYLYDAFKDIAERHPNFNFRICLSREENLAGLDEVCYGVGRVNSHLEVFLDRHKDAAVKPKNEIMNAYEYYICGSKTTVDSLKEFALTMGVLPENVAFERFTL